MTKKNKTNKKLRLSTETVRRISDEQLKKIAGGPADGLTDIISFPCSGLGC